jgi:hypothetical protein
MPEDQPEQALGWVVRRGLFGIYKLEAPAQKRADAFGKERALARKMAVEDGSGDAQFAHNRGDMRLPITLCDQFLGSQSQYPVVHALMLLRGQIHAAFAGLLDRPLQLFLDLLQSEPGLLEFYDLSQYVEVVPGVEGPAAGGLLGAGEQAYAQIVVDPRDLG